MFPNLDFINRLQRHRQIFFARNPYWFEGNSPFCCFAQIDTARQLMCYILADPPFRIACKAELLSTGCLYKSANYPNCLIYNKCSGQRPFYQCIQHFCTDQLGTNFFLGGRTLKTPFIRRRIRGCSPKLNPSTGFNVIDNAEQ